MVAILDQLLVNLLILLGLYDLGALCMFEPTLIRVIQESCFMSQHLYFGTLQLEQGEGGYAVFCLHVT